MRLEDLDFDALINQFWGSEADLQAFLDSESAGLCSRICGPQAPVPKFLVVYPPLKGKLENGSSRSIPFAPFKYRAGEESTPPTIFIWALVAGNKPKLPQFIAYALIHHWEALGAIGEDAWDYPESILSLIKESCVSMSEKDFKDSHSPRFIAKAVQVARDLEVSLKEFLFPTISLSVYFPQPKEGADDSSKKNGSVP